MFARCLSVVLFVFVGSLGSASLRADEYLVEAMGGVLDAANSLHDQSEFGYDINGHICLLGAFVQPGQYVSLDRAFESGKRYAILAGGDRDAHDINIQVSDPRGRLLARDTEDDANPAVDFRASMSGLHKVRVHLHDASQPSFVFVAMLIEDGYKVPPSSQVQAAANLLARLEAISTMCEVNPLQTEANWAVYGSILAGNESTAINNINFGRGLRAVLTGSDNVLSDLDLFIQVNRSEQVLASDEEPDSVPYVSRLFSGGQHRICVKNTMPNGEPTLVLTGIVELE